MVEGVLNAQQKTILAALNRIEQSLHGPAALLAAGGGFSRPAPPPQPRPSPLLDDSMRFPNY